MEEMKEKIQTLVSKGLDTLPEEKVKTIYNCLKSLTEENRIWDIINWLKMKPTGYRIHIENYSSLPKTNFYYNEDFQKITNRYKDIQFTIFNLLDKSLNIFNDHLEKIWVKKSKLPSDEIENITETVKYLNESLTKIENSLETPNSPKFSMTTALPKDIDFTNARLFVAFVLTYFYLERVFFGHYLLEFYLTGEDMTTYMFQLSSFDEENKSKQEFINFSNVNYFIDFLRLYFIPTVMKVLNKMNCALLPFSEFIFTCYRDDK